MEPTVDKARDNFIQGLSRISSFWGFPKGMGAIYGVIYLSPEPVGLDAIVDQAKITKGAVSTNVKKLERLGMIHKHLKVGDRKDYYTAEIDFWKIIKGILREREKSEFDLALKSVAQSLDILKQGNIKKQEQPVAGFYTDRMKAMQKFFDTLDKIVAVVLALDSIGPESIKKILVGKSK